MADNQITSFENELYAFLTKVLNNPAMLKKNSVELKGILNKLRLLNKPGELEATLKKLGFLMTVNPRLYTNPNAAIEEIERNIFRLAQDEPARKMKILQYLNSLKLYNQKYTNRVTTREKYDKALMDFIKG